ncbi:MAG: type II toxin-antitoxin system YafQ family toxin [Firmicutes bacterium]|nr:type II toxin-antitoxin system YafQ family toxin [Bacillota bacterium]
MRTISYSSKFKRDYKLMKKRGKDLSKLQIVAELLEEGKPLDRKYSDHPLIGNYKGYRDLHIEPDWLLIYKISGNEIEFYRTGSHSDLF